MHYHCIQYEEQLIINKMKRKFLITLFALLFSWIAVGAQEIQKSELQQRAEDEGAKGHVATARYTYIRAFEDYFDKGQSSLGVDCGTKATALYYKENYYKEAFELLRRVDQTIDAKEQGAARSALHYMVTKERLKIYMKLRKSANAAEQLNILENHANASGDEKVKDDLLLTKANYYYSTGQNEKGNEILAEVTRKLTSDEDNEKIDELFQTLIANGLNSNSATMVSQSYCSYMAWKDSLAAQKAAAEVAALKQQIAANETVIADKDSSLSSRSTVIVGLSILAAILAAVLVLGAIVLLRFIALTRKQKATIEQVKESSAQKAKFINNISAQLAPSLQKLDGSIPEVKALTEFSDHIQTLAAIETDADENLEMEDVQVQPFCESMLEEIRSKVKPNVELMMKAQKTSASINKKYVTHILQHLLGNAALYTPEGEHITIDFKKRSVHTQQFIVSNTGSSIPEEKREDVFKPFLEVKDLAQGDGLGLPICKAMAQKMNGDLTIDSTFTKGVRFILDLHV